MEQLTISENPCCAVILCGDPLLSRLLELELAQCGISVASEGMEGGLWLIDLDDHGDRLHACPEKSQILCWSHQGIGADAPPWGNREGVCFLKRPFSLSELELCLARISAGQWATGNRLSADLRSLSAVGEGNSGTASVKAALIRPLSQGLVAVGHEQVTLTPREWALFSCLWEARGETVPKERLWETLCAVRDARGMPVTNTLEVYMCHLRRKLEKPLARRLIHTERGKGYRLGYLGDSPCILCENMI